MPQTPNTAAAPAQRLAFDAKPGHFFHDVYLGGATITVECYRDEGTVIVDGALINGRMVRYLDCLDGLFIRWGEEVEADLRDDAEQDNLDFAIDAREEKARTFAHYSGLALEAVAA